MSIALRMKAITRRVMYLYTKLSMLCLLSTFILPRCVSMYSKNNTNFHWLAQESAPREYPMRVINGTFYYHNQDNGLYIPTAAKIGYRWGEGASVHAGG